VESLVFEYFRVLESLRARTCKSLRCFVHMSAAAVWSPVDASEDAVRAAIAGHIHPRGGSSMGGAERGAVPQHSSAPSRVSAAELAAVCTCVRVCVCGEKAARRGAALL
jgi:hypothetical protein